MCLAGCDCSAGQTTSTRNVTANEEPEPGDPYTCKPKRVPAAKHFPMHEKQEVGPKLLFP